MAKAICRSGRICLHGGGYEYWIDSDRCDTPEKILAWVLHLAPKTWVTAEVLRQFVQLATSINNVKVDWSM